MNLPEVLTHKTNEDGERVHRLEHEWNGDKEANIVWSRYVEDKVDISVWWEVAWTDWAIGADISHNQWNEWSYTKKVRLDTRTWQVTASLGPLHVGATFKRWLS